MAQEKTNYTPFILGGLLLYFYNDIFGKTKEEKADDKATAEAEAKALRENPFSTGTFKVAMKEGYKRFTITSPTVVKAIKLIYDGIGYVVDDEAKVMSAIKMAGTKGDIFLIAGLYSSTYKKDLYNELKSNLPETIGQINAYVNKLPLYIKGTTN